MSETWMPGATIERGPYDRGAHGGPVVQHLGVVEHVTTNWADPGPFFANPVNQASSHFWIRVNGTIVQYLPLEVASWAQAGGNYSYVSVETDGVVTVQLSDAQVLSLAAVYAWVQSLHGFGFHLAEAPGQAGLGWHGMGGAGWGGHGGCPGELRKAQRPAVLYLAAGAPAHPSHDVVAPAIDPPLPGGYVDCHLTSIFPFGEWMLRDDGSIYTIGAANYPGGFNTLPGFAGRMAARFVDLTPDERATGHAVACLATSGERYAT